MLPAPLVYVLQRRSPVRGNDCHSSGMLSQQYDTSAVVSARAHGFCSVLLRVLSAG